MIRGKLLAAVFVLVGVLVGAVLIAAHGCRQRPRLIGTLRPTEQRNQKLFSLAADEAALIEDIDARITRLLNLAETQIQRKHVADARATLAATRKTLASSELAQQLNDHARVSGWVSTSELSRQANDTEGATTACDGALAAVRAIEDPSLRCEYVMGVCNELQYLRGGEAAAIVLAEAGPWTKAIDDVPRRRQAVVSFSAALFNLDDYARGQQMLRQEDDAVWRSDTLLQLASLPLEDEWRYPESATASPREPSMNRPAPASQPIYFGKRLGYRDVFQGQRQSQTRN